MLLSNSSPDILLRMNVISYQKENVKENRVYRIKVSPGWKNFVSIHVYYIFVTALHPNPQFKDSL